MTQIKIYSVQGNQAPKDGEKLENLINNFISENNIDVVDIKYSTAMTENPYPHYVASAMIIYNTK